MKELIKRLIIKSIHISTNKILNFLNVTIVFRFGSGIGDQLCMVAIAEALNKQCGNRVVVVTHIPEIFYNNPYIYKIVKADPKTKFGSIIKKIVYISEGEYVKRFAFHPINGVRFEEYQQKTQNRKSLIEVHSLHFREKINYKNLKPNIYFLSNEINYYKKLLPKYKYYALVNPNSKTTYTPNKDWGFENFQKVINQTKDDITWIQVGLKSEKLLDGVIDFRGKTPSLRLLAYLIKNATFTFSNEGMYTHLSAAVDTPSFTVFGGFLPIELSLYNTTIPIVQSSMPECAYCWLREPCPYPKKLCFEELDIDNISQQLLSFWREKLKS